MRVALLGYGKMGKALHKTLEEEGHTIGFIHETQDSIEASDPFLSCDVAIEFTGPENAVQNLIFCAEQGLPVVSGTTGWLDKWSEVETFIYLEPHPREKKSRGRKERGSGKRRDKKRKKKQSREKRNEKEREKVRVRETNYQLNVKLKR